MDFHRKQIGNTLMGMKMHEPMAHAVKKVSYPMPNLQSVVRHMTHDAKMVRPDVEPCHKHAPKTKPIYGMIQLEMRR